MHAQVQDPEELEELEIDDLAHMVTAKPAAAELCSHGFRLGVHCWPE